MSYTSCTVCGKARAELVTETLGQVRRYCSTECATLDGDPKCRVPTGERALQVAALRLGMDSTLVLVDTMGEYGKTFKFPKPLVQEAGFSLIETLPLCEYNSDAAGYALGHMFMVLQLPSAAQYSATLGEQRSTSSGRFGEQDIRDLSGAVTMSILPIDCIDLRAAIGTGYDASGNVGNCPTDSRVLRNLKMMQYSAYVAANASVGKPMSTATGATVNAGVDSGSSVAKAPIQTAHFPFKLASNIEAAIGGFSDTISNRVDRMKEKLRRYKAEAQIHTTRDEREKFEYRRKEVMSLLKECMLVINAIISKLDSMSKQVSNDSIKSELRSTIDASLTQLRGRYNIIRQQLNDTINTVTSLSTASSPDTSDTDAGVGAEQAWLGIKKTFNDTIESYKKLKSGGSSESLSRAEADVLAVRSIELSIKSALIDAKNIVEKIGHASKSALKLLTAPSTFRLDKIKEAANRCFIDLSGLNDELNKNRQELQRVAGSIRQQKRLAVSSPISDDLDRTMACIGTELDREGQETTFGALEGLQFQDDNLQALNGLRMCMHDVEVQSERIAHAINLSLWQCSGIASNLLALDTNAQYQSVLFSNVANISGESITDYMKLVMAVFPSIKICRYQNSISLPAELVNTIDILSCTKNLVNHVQVKANILSQGWVSVNDSLTAAINEIIDAQTRYFLTDGTLISKLEQGSKTGLDLIVNQEVSRSYLDWFAPTDVIDLAIDGLLYIKSARGKEDYLKHHCELAYLRQDILLNAAFDRMRACLCWLIATKTQLSELYRRLKALQTYVTDEQVQALQQYAKEHNNGVVFDAFIADTIVYCQNVCKTEEQTNVMLSALCTNVLESIHKYVTKLSECKQLDNRILRLISGERINEIGDTSDETSADVGTGVGAAPVGCGTLDIRQRMNVENMDTIATYIGSRSYESARLRASALLLADAARNMRKAIAKYAEAMDYIPDDVRSTILPADTNVDTFAARTSPQALLVWTDSACNTLSKAAQVSSAETSAPIGGSHTS